MLNSTVEIYIQSPVITSDGTLKKVWQYQGFCGGVWDDSQVWNDNLIWYDGADVVMTMDVQPKSLSEAQLKQWGISTLSQDAKAVYDFIGSPYFVIGNRARVDYGTVYDIRARNEWPSHLEYILVPVAGQ
jgi:hypothetical protein